MHSMFRGATKANPDTRNWDVSNVENMSCTLQGAKSANPDTSKWDVSEVMFKDNMFNGSAYTGKSL